MRRKLPRVLWFTTLPMGNAFKTKSFAEEALKLKTT